MVLLKRCEGSWGLEGKLEEKRAKEESSWGGEMRTFKREKLSHYLVLHFQTGYLIY